jgi:hypothetical protein
MMTSAIKIKRQHYCYAQVPCRMRIGGNSRQHLDFGMKRRQYCCIYFGKRFSSFKILFLPQKSKLI